VKRAAVFYAFGIYESACEATDSKQFESVLRFSCSRLPELSSETDGFSENPI